VFRGLALNILALGAYRHFQESVRQTTAYSAVHNLALRISQLVMVYSSNPASVTFKVSVTSSPMLSTSADRVLPASGGCLATQDGRLRTMDQDRRGQKNLRNGPLSGCISQKLTKNLLAPL
jgi:hypothetical protein